MVGGESVKSALIELRKNRMLRPANVNYVETTTFTGKEPIKIGVIIQIEKLYDAEEIANGEKISGNTYKALFECIYGNIRRDIEKLRNEICNTNMILISRQVDADLVYRLNMILKTLNPNTYLDEEIEDD